MRKMKLSPFLLVLPVILISCEYKPNEIYRSVIEENINPPAIEIVKLDINDDTLFVYFDHLIEFVFSSSDQPVRWVRFTIDLTEQSIVYSAYGSFSISRQNLTAGYHTLRIDVFTGSGTGSIADALGMEGFLFSKDWIISAEPYGYARIGYEINNGFLKLKWDELRSKDLKQYIISRQAASSEEVTFEIARVKQTEFIDSVYIGEGADYTVHADFNSGIKYLWGYIRIDGNMPELKFKPTVENKYFVTWPDLKFTGSTGKMIICSWVYDEPLDSVILPFDTCYHLKDACFADFLYYNVRILPKYKYKSFPQFKNEIKTMILNWGMGYTFPGYNSLSPCSVNEIILARGKYLSRYSLLTSEASEDKVFPDRYQYSLSVSPGGKYLTFHSIPQGELYFCDAHDFSKDSSTTIYSQLEDNYGSGISLSDKGIGIIKTSTGTICIYDFLKKELLLQYTPQQSVNSFVISGDASYVCLQSDSVRMYRFQGNELVLLWKVLYTNSVKYLGFTSTFPNHFIFWDNINFSFRNCEDFSAISQYPFSNKTVINYDLLSNRILTWVPGHLIVYDLDNGFMLYDIPSNLDDYEIQYFRVSGNSILAFVGLRYFLN